ncbi:hypothetical protein BC940DRAFT_300572 [Gongronella butleri]|nr:hypothetical protein BC940DRAFT_300572 [Gongronella butleri]
MAFLRFFFVFFFSVLTMPGLMNQTSNTSTPQDGQSYERLARFVLDHQSGAHHFTIDDDNHGMAILCAHNDQDPRREATTVRLDKGEVRRFMMSHGYNVHANLPDNDNYNPTFSASGFICTK